MIEAIELTKSYAQHSALEHLNLKIDQGDVFCLLGQNGAGKTTTINLFLGFITPTSGKALIKGVEVKPNDPSIKRFLAYIPEIVMLYSNLTGTENLDFFSQLAGFRYNKTELEAYLQQTGLATGAFNQRVSSYSKGMRQKVGIAIAIAKNADVIFMDEPTSGLDPIATSEFNQLVGQLSQQGKTVFMATHDIFNAVETASHIGIMRQGKLVHIKEASKTNATDLQKLYLETIS